MIKSMDYGVPAKFKLDFIFSTMHLISDIIVDIDCVLREISNWILHMEYHLTSPIYFNRLVNKNFVVRNYQI